MELLKWDAQTQKYVTYFVTSASALYLMYKFMKARRRKFEHAGYVAALYCYPIKSCAAMELEFAEVTNFGLRYQDVTDRHLMIIDKDRKTINLKHEPRLWSVTSTVGKDSILIDAPDMPRLQIPKTIPPTKKNTITMKVYEKCTEVIDCGDEVSNWISQFINRPGTRIVHADHDLSKRDVSKIPRAWKTNSKNGDMTAFSSSTSYLLESLASLRLLNERLEKPASMLRFRPNIVIDGAKAFDEDNWECIRIGEDNIFRNVEPCRRCIITTIDPATCIKEPDQMPWKHLKSFRCREPYGQGPLFGLYITRDVPSEKPGLIRAGQPVYVQWR